MITKHVEDPPAPAAVPLPLPVPGREHKARLALREKYAELFSQLPKSRLNLQSQLLELARLSGSAEEVLACGLEIAAMSGAAGDLASLDLALTRLQDRLLAAPEELQRLLLQEFGGQNIPLFVLEKLVGRWEQLAEAYVSKFDLTNAGQCLKEASEIARRDAKLSAVKVPQFEHKITLYARAQQEMPAITEALAALEKNPEDAAAHKSLGVFLIRRLEDYPRGFRHLVRGDDAALVKLAMEELAGPKKVEEMVRLADGWVQAGQTVKPDEEARWYYERAVYWYRQAYALQLQDNALLANGIAERWKKAVVRFADLPAPHRSGFIREQKTELKVLTALALSGDKVVVAGRVGDDSLVLAYEADTAKQIGRWNLQSSVRWLESCGRLGHVAVGLSDGSFMWLELSDNQGLTKQVSSAGDLYHKGAFAEKAERFIVLSNQRLFTFLPGFGTSVQERTLSRPPGTGSPDLAVTPKGDHLVIVGRSTSGIPLLMLADSEGKLLDTYSYGSKGSGSPIVALSTDGAMLASAWQKEVTFFPMPVPGKGEKLVPDNPIGVPNTVTAMAAHPHQGMFILGFEDGSIGLLAIQGKRLLVFKGMVNQPVRSLAVHGERRQVYIGYANGVLGVFALPPE
ncbi:hypothetical protein HRbin36_02880 [bacterium HR36]|nr:hypothetical protein HRbin36_02880 [bacterium HR36]